MDCEQVQTPDKQQCDDVRPCFHVRFLGTAFHVPTRFRRSSPWGRGRSLCLGRCTLYGKIFGSLFEGSMRGQSNLILVFINMLCRCNPDGTDDRNPRAIADETGLPLKTVQDVLLTLESPDPESRTPDNEGRRIRLLDAHRKWGWCIINYAKYQEIRSEIDRREQNRRASAKYRQQNDDASAAVSSRQHKSAASAPVAVTVAVTGTISESINTPPVSSEPGFSLQPQELPGIPPPPPKPPDPEIQYMVRLGSLFRRKSTTPWSSKEEKKIYDLKTCDADIQLIEWFYGEPRKNRKPTDTDLWKHDLVTLLNNWTSALDRARSFKAKPQGHCTPGKPIPAATYEEAVARMGL